MSSVEENQAETVQLDLSEFRSGFVVGVKNNGDLVFDVIGENPGMVELFGLVDFASYNLNQLRTMHDGGTPIERLTQLSQAMVAMLKVMMHTLTNRLPAPDTGPETPVAAPPVQPEPISPLVDIEPLPTGE